MRGKKPQKLVIPLAVTFLFSVLAATALAVSFSARLSGKNEAPPVKTMATGRTVFTFFMDHGELGLDYKLYVKHIKDATAAHIHLGKKGENGPPVAVLFNGPEKKGMFSGLLAHGRVHASDLIGPLKGKTLSDLMHRIVHDEAYVNVHTAGHPDGEIRGQLKCPEEICPAPFWRKEGPGGLRN
ncbi:MAG: CHRD domain-containing protein [Nitrospiraceae bacterium]|nr:CHRD domain-containing protein [Nitrospiraceae bacterium]